MFNISLDQLIVWLLVGGLAGSVAGAIITRRRKGYGRAKNLILGMAGAVVGGLAFNLLRIDLGVQSIAVSFEDLLSALTGSLLLIFALWFIRKKQRADEDETTETASIPAKRSRLRTSLWVGLGLLVLIGVPFCYLYFVLTNRALMSAESFSFRRMQVMRVDDERTFRFFYVSNRQLTAGEEPLEERFTSQREEQLKFGRFDTSIDPSLGLGMLIDPTDWLQNEAIGVEDIQTLEQEAFVEELAQLVDASPARSVLVVIHGYREGFPSALRKTAFISHVLDLNSPVLLFDWPGDQGSSLRGYNRARKVAESSGKELADTLDLLVREAGAERVAVLANSMGCQVVADAFSILYQREEWADDDIELDDVILTAPDVGHEEFGERFKEEITALAKNVTVYVSSNDRALLASRLINREKRLGEATFSAPSEDQFEEAVLIADLIEPGNDRVALVDVTPVNRTRNFHNFSLETPEFFDDLFLRLTNDEDPRSRLLYPVTTAEGVVYWVLTRGR